MTHDDALVDQLVERLRIEYIWIRHREAHVVLRILREMGEL